MTLTLITAASSYPVKIRDVKANGRIIHDEEDGLLFDLIAAATDYAERHIGAAIVQQTWEQVFDAFPDGVLVLGMGPIASVVSIRYIDAADAEQTLAASAYLSDTEARNGRIEPVDAWPATADRIAAVRVRFTVGAANLSAVPRGIRQAILMTVEHWNEHRAAATGGPVMEVPLGARMLLDQHRRMHL